MLYIINSSARGVSFLKTRAGAEREKERDAENGNAHDVYQRDANVHDGRFVPSFCA
jgi:hypothetical protein